MKGRKAKGTRNELRTRNYLRELGYQVARFAGSFGPWEVAGFREQDIVLVQVKSARWPGSQEMKAMRDFPAPRNCQKLIHRWQPYARQPEVRRIP